jgi:hypothetical protein
MQRVLDALEPSPAIVKTSTWDIVAWNRAAPPRAADAVGLFSQMTSYVVTQRRCRPM